MEGPILSAEQFEKLLAKITKDPAPAATPTGLGAIVSPKSTGLGCGGDGGFLSREIAKYLALGSPRLALAVALGVRLAPYLISVRAQFEDTDTTDIPSEGSDVKIVQDTMVDAMVVRLTNQSEIANSSVLQTLSDFFFNFQSGIEANLDVQGAPRYTVAPHFTPLSTMADVVVGGSHWPGGWVLTYQQQLLMAFHASVSLPFAPIDVACTFRAWVPTGEMFVEMTNREAMQKLEDDCGIVLTDAYKQRITNSMGR